MELDWTDCRDRPLPARLRLRRAPTQVAASGDLVVGGWSDGGNSCFLNQPYDLTIRRKASKFGDSTWGAGVLSVAHIMKLDSETMELQGGCTWLTYNPTENKPNSCRINSLNELSDGRVVFTGGSTFGLIESPDAWVEACGQPTNATQPKLR